MPDLEVQTIKIQITMKKKQNLQEPQQKVLNIPVVVRSAFLNVKEAQIQFSNACEKYIESKPHQDMIKALKRAGAF